MTTEKNNKTLNLDNYKNVTAQVEIVTPAMAQKWINDGVEHNRDIRKGVVRRYVTDIKNGEWEMNGEPFIVNNKGLLNNGFHRSYAIVATNTPIVSVVVRGVEPNTYKSMDGGTNRTPADVLRAFGVLSHHKEKAGTISKYLGLINNKFICSAEGDTNLTASGKIGSRNMKVLETYKNNQELFDEIVDFALNIKKKRKNLMSKIKLTLGDIAGIVAYLHTEKGYSIEQVESFFNELFEMNDVEKKQNPYIMDFRKIMKDNYDAINKFPPKIRQAYLAKTWNLYVEKMVSKSKKLTLTKEEEKSGVKFM